MEIASTMKDYIDSKQGILSVDSDSAKGQGPVFVMISSRKMLHCCICFRPFRQPVLECDWGHVMCYTCGQDNCPKCSWKLKSSWKLKHNRAFENLLNSMIISCPYEKYGCMKSMSYIESSNHKCTYMPCFCPLLGCDFVAPSKVLSDHFIHKHKNFRIPFLYDVSFTISFNSFDEAIILQEQNDGELFIVNPRNVRMGNAVNISLIGPKISVKGYPYDILARSPTNCSLKLQSFTESIQEVTLKHLPSEFLEIPFGFFGSSESFKLEICINSKPCIKESDSDNKDGEYLVDSTNGSVYVMIFDLSVLHCCYCLRPLKMDAFLCDLGHVLCRDCPRGKCPKCSRGMLQNRAFSILFNHMKISCPYNGCMMKMGYIESKNHKCPYLLCFCPLSSCDFVAPSKVLSDHFIHKHGNFRTSFLYDVSFTISFNSFDEVIILQEQNDGKLFIVNCSTVLMGNAVNISLIGPKTSVKGYRYDILARSLPYPTLKFQSFTENIQQVTLKPLSSDFLEIPFGFFISSQPFQLQICIKSKMKIFVNSYISQRKILLEVESVETIQDVMQQIKDQEGTPILDQRLIAESKQLELYLTVADYNINEESLLSLVHRL